MKQISKKKALYTALMPKGLNEHRKKTMKKKNEIGL